MNEWLLRQGVDTPQLGLLLGVLAGLLLAVVFSWWASRRSARASSVIRRAAVAFLASWVIRSGLNGFSRKS